MKTLPCSGVCCLPAALGALQAAASAPVTKERSVEEMRLALQLYCTRAFTDFNLPLGKGTKILIL